MVWPAISIEIKKPLFFMVWNEENENYGCTARSYILALEDELLLIYQPGQPFQQDNAHIHITSMTQEWHEDYGIWVIGCPPCSSDLNSIERVWRTLNHDLYWLYYNIHELKDNTADMEILTTRIKEAWEWIDQVHIQTLVSSIPVWLDTYRDAWGWYTKYLLGALQLLNILFFLVCSTFVG